MRAVIVSSKTLAKYGRWDAPFYCGTRRKTQYDEKLARAEKRLKLEKRRIKQARLLVAAEKRRIHKMIKAAEVRPAR